jgi:hypothetical protein
MMTEQQARDLAEIQNQGFENVKGDLTRFGRGAAAPINEDVLHLEDATVRTSNTQIVDVTEDAEAVTRRVSRQVGR